MMTGETGHVSSVALSHGHSGCDAQQQAAEQLLLQPASQHELSLTNRWAMCILLLNGCIDDL